jgi:hypothetical protein
VAGQTHDAYLVRVGRPDDPFSDQWLESALAVNGELKFTIGCDAEKAMRMPKALADAIAQIKSSETWVLKPVKFAAVKLAIIMAAEAR